MIVNNNIRFSNKIINSIIVDTISKIPGIDKNKSIDANFSNKTNIIDIKCSISKDIDNVYSVMREIQNYVFFRLCKMFDTTNIKVNLEII